MAVLVLADVALIWLAFTSTRSAEATVEDQFGVPSARPSPSANPTPTPTPTPTPSATPEPVAPAVAALSVVLGALDDTVAYRAVTGPCPSTGALVEVTDDGGATWSSGVEADARSIQSISVSSVEVSMVAADPSSCAPMVQRSFVEGADWEAIDDLGTRWYLDGGRVVSPGAVASTPCGRPVQVAPRSSTEAALLCEDATVWSTTDGGAAWSTSAPLAGAVSLSAGTDGYAVAVAGVNGCAGVSVIPLTTELQPGAPGGCVAASVAPGSTVIAAGGGVLWLWSGDVVARSFDGGATW